MAGWQEAHLPGVANTGHCVADLAAGWHHLPSAGTIICRIAVFVHTPAVNDTVVTAQRCQALMPWTT